MIKTIYLLLSLQIERVPSLSHNMPDKVSVCRENDARFNYLREPTDASGDLLTRDLFRSTMNRPLPIPIRLTFSYRKGAREKQDRAALINGASS